MHIAERHVNGHHISCPDTKAQIDSLTTLAVAIQCMHRSDPVGHYSRLESLYRELARGIRLSTVGRFEANRSS